MIARFKDFKNVIITGYFETENENTICRIDVEKRLYFKDNGRTFFTKETMSLKNEENLLGIWKNPMASKKITDFMFDSPSTQIVNLEAKKER